MRKAGPASLGLLGALSQPGGSGVEVALFREARCLAGGLLVHRAGTLEVTSHFQEMGADCVQTMMSGNPVVGVESFEEGETGSRPIDHGNRNRAIERDNRSWRHPFEHAVQRQDLRPVRLLGARCFVMHCGDRCLQLVRTKRRLAGVRVTSATPSSIWAVFQRSRCCSSSGTSEPSAFVRAARRASVSSIRASGPATSPSSGMSW